MSGRKSAPKRCERAMSTSEKKLELDLCMYQSISRREERECMMMGAKRRGMVDVGLASSGDCHERRLMRKVKRRRCHIRGRDLRLIRRNVRMRRKAA